MKNLIQLIIFILLNALLYIRTKRILDIFFLRISRNCEGLDKEYESLICAQSRLKKDTDELQGILERKVALYDTVKDIRKNLDKDKILESFYNQVHKYIRVRDCKMLLADTDISQYKEYIVMPLEIERELIGYLVASEMSEEDKDKFIVLAQQFTLGIKRAFLYQRLQELAITDGLTGVFSRRYSLERLEEEIERSNKFNHKFSAAMLDIDHFKSYNDRYGHLVGDAILKEVSRATKDSIRQIDLIGRYGGEEFLIILTETDKDQAVFAGERIRKSIEDNVVRVYDEELKITVSIGISTFPDDAKDKDTLIDKADEALYKAKETGRNKVCVYAIPK